MKPLPDKVRAWLNGPMADELRPSIERIAALEDVAHIALMPDVHLAENVCNGAVVATRHSLMPDAVGGDIGCGMTAVQLDVRARSLRPRTANRLLERLAKAVPVDRHQTKLELPACLQAIELSTMRLQRTFLHKSAVQLGTLGSGNHFLELQARCSPIRECDMPRGISSKHKPRRKPPLLWRTRLERLDTLHSLRQKRIARSLTRILDERRSAVRQGPGVTGERRGALRSAEACNDAWSL